MVTIVQMKLTTIQTMKTIMHMLIIIKTNPIMETIKTIQMMEIIHKKTIVAQVKKTILKNQKNSHRNIKRKKKTLEHPRFKTN